MFTRDLDELQLGHAGEGVEILISPHCQRTTGPRFNWATPVKAWRCFWPCRVRLSVVLLQLGHAGEGVEIMVGTSAHQHTPGFNWATPVKAWRLGLSSLVVWPSGQASIGPRR